MAYVNFLKKQHLDMFKKSATSTKDLRRQHTRNIEKSQSTTKRLPRFCSATFISIFQKSSLLKYTKASSLSEQTGIGAGKG